MVLDCRDFSIILAVSLCSSISMVTFHLSLGSTYLYFLPTSPIDMVIFTRTPVSLVVGVSCQMLPESPHGRDNNSTSGTSVVSLATGASCLGADVGVQGFKGGEWLTTVIAAQRKFISNSFLGHWHIIRNILSIFDLIRNVLRLLLDHMFWNDQGVILFSHVSVIPSIYKRSGGCFCYQRHLYSQDVHEPVELDKSISARDDRGPVQELGQAGHHSAAHPWQKEAVLEVGRECVGQNIPDEGAGCREDEAMDFDVSSILGDQDDIRVLTR